MSMEMNSTVRPRNPWRCVQPPEPFSMIAKYLLLQRNAVKIGHLQDMWSGCVSAVLVGTYLHAYV